jgi:hypothetical protein
MSLITSILLDCPFHGRWNVTEYPDTGLMTPVSHFGAICLCKTKTFQFSIHNMSQEVTPHVNMEELESCSLVKLTIDFKVLSHPTMPNMT